MYADHTIPTLAFSSNRVPASFQFLAYLPGRGVRAMVATVSSCVASEAEVSTVALSSAEVLARRESVQLSWDDEGAAGEAAADFLEALCQGVALNVAQAASAEQAVRLQRKARTEAQEDGEPLDYQHFS